MNSFIHGSAVGSMVALSFHLGHLYLCLFILAAGFVHFCYLESKGAFK